MKRYIPIIVAVLVLAGGAGYALTRDKNDSSNNTNGNQSQTSGNSGAFDAVSTANLSFEATMTTVSGDKTITAVMQSDAKTGAVKYVGGTFSDTMTMIYTKDAYYMCQSADKCFKYPLGQGTGASFDPSTYQYDDSKIADYKSASTSLGRQSCSSGTCDVWKVTSNGYDSKVFIDSKTKRVVQVEGATAEATTKIVYEYKDVNVEIPQNAQTLPNISVPAQ